MIWKRVLLEHHQHVLQHLFMHKRFQCIECHLLLRIQIFIQVTGPLTFIQITRPLRIWKLADILPKKRHHATYTRRKQSHSIKQILAQQGLKSFQHITVLLFNHIKHFLVSKTKPRKQSTKQNKAQNPTPLYVISIFNTKQ